MALFQKKPLVGSNLPLYTLSSLRTVLIIGLGNPGKKYQNTRHNIGFEAVGAFGKDNDFPDWLAKRDLKCQLSFHNLGETRVILCRPTTFMNLSGEAAATVQRFYRVDNAQTLAIYDELAIPFGQLRTRVGGSDAGHNGVKSLIQHLGPDFGRLRIGIGGQATRKASDADFVLAKFGKAEQTSLPLVLGESNALITEYVFSGQLPHDTRTAVE